ncbi:MAG: hypothetical protein K8S99_15235 [Planctomycetes bacterium]|nr:hypothetical protein [Planctomycetota bacterium]
MTDDRRSFSTAAIAAVWTGLAAAFLLGGYEFVRSASGTLFQKAYGKERMVYLMAGMPIGVLLLVWVYGRILSFAGPRLTLIVTTLGSAVLLAAANAALAAGWRPASVILYILREAYVVLIIEQYWSFLNSTLGDANARRLNGPICGVASLGAIACGWFVSRYTGHTLLFAGVEVVVTTPNLPYLAALLALPAAFCSDMAYRVTGEPADTPPRREPHRAALALREFARAPMLICLLGVILATQVIAASIELRFWDKLGAAITLLDQRTAYAAGVFVTINIIAGVLQFVASPLLLRWAPLRVIHVAIPLMHVTACGVMIAQGGLGFTVFTYTLFKCVDYSVFRAAKELLYIPLGFDARYRAKEVIDVFGYRFGKGGSATALSAAQAAGAVLTSAYGWTALLAALVWAVLAWPLTRHPITRDLEQS